MLCASRYVSCRRVRLAALGAPPPSRPATLPPPAPSRRGGLRRCAAAAVDRPRRSARRLDPRGRRGRRRAEPAAPVVTTRSPSLRPSRISICVSSSMPTVDRPERRRCCPSAARNTPRRPPMSTTRVGRDDERVLALVGRDADARVHARLQAEAGIRNLDLDRRRARRRVEHRRDARDAADERLAGERVDFDLRCVAGSAAA